MHKSSSIGDKGLIINIKVEPRSSRSEIVGPYGNGLKVKLTSPPVEGKANKELIMVLAKGFKISKADVEIISGNKSKTKTVRLIGVKGIEELIE
ncbi:MAG: YggU family protein [Nitrospirae bacterium]|nr:YggU family protein [Nitrospirota bacterium]